jgi:adenylate cyclase
MTLGSALLVIRGFGDPAVEEAYLRAEELCQQLGEPAERFGVLGGLWGFYTNRTEYSKARELAEHFLHQAEQEAQPYFLTWGHHRVTEPLLALGKLSQARTHAKQAIALYDAEMHRPHTARIGGDPKVMSCSYSALVLWLLGYPDRALKRCEEGLGLARELGVPFALTYALVCAAFFHLLRRDGAAAQALAEEVIAVSTQHGFATRKAQGTIYRGGAFVLQGHIEDGIAQLQQRLAAMRASGSDMLRSHYLGLLVEAYAEGGQVAEGYVRQSEALEIVDKSDERMCEAELYRLKGELVLQSRVQSQKPRRVFRRLFTLPVTSRRDRGSCVPRRG